MVLEPQRERFGLCGAVPSLPYVVAWSDNYARNSNIVVASWADLVTSISRINIYSMPEDIRNTSNLQKALLPVCPDPPPFSGMCAVPMLEVSASSRAGLLLTLMIEGPASFTQPIGRKVGTSKPMTVNRVYGWPKRSNAKVFIRISAGP